MKSTESSFDVRRFLNENRTPIASEMLFCVDGRIYQSGGVAGAGADIGFIYAVATTANQMGLNLSIEDMVEGVMNVCGDKFHNHTNCGHAQKPTQYPQLYGLKIGQAEAIMEVINHSKYSHK